MGDGFRVDVEAIKTAGLGIAELMASLTATQVDDVDATPGAVGHPGLASGVAGFCDRWQVGAENLTKDGEQLSRNLIDCAGTYLAIEQDLVFALGGSAEDLVDAEGGARPPDPATVKPPRVRPGMASPARAELGETADPLALVPGDPVAVTTTASSLSRYGQLLSETGESLRTLGSSGWEGKAGDSFRAYFDGEPQRWVLAGESFGSASTSLDSFVHTLRWAQEQAREALRLWGEGQAATERALADRRASAMPTPEAVDPGEPLRRAQEALQRAREQLDKAGQQSAKIVVEAQAAAPQERGLLDGIGDALDAIGDALGAVGGAIADIPGNLLHNSLDSVADVGDAVGTAVGAGIQGVGLLGGELHELGGEAASTMLSSAGRALGSETLEDAGKTAEVLGDRQADAARTGMRSAGEAVIKWADGEADFVRQRADEAAETLGAEDPTGEGADPEPHYVIIDPERYPKTSLHILQAQEGISFRGDESTAYPKQQPSVLTYDPPGNENNERRGDALRGIPARGREGLDRDEYPPAVFSEGGDQSSVKYLPSRDNQAAGASMGRQMRSLDDGDAVRIVVG
ncbi:NucA/NucB deoxyribonuclease domain-containing protein [Saccharopolyspora sp. NFXS83]|uniref:putative T7SS-secreted protein n=1 Tax=Saccharopolyspora sp. NFXS83 TaxID=2993560 RepID=UPI00224B42C5|nr:NucA/NucB deoxyribonuclease domain-containing protein [Saccharopolyspora sp. NFXS83]MCX2729409.1 NucA/NucB deoxyribonuclease domain-containing protein [Saccharopolyspora sp. NFXS83]